MQTNTLKDQNLNQKTINYSLNLGQMWRLWAKALGEKAHKKDQIADQVAVVRTVIFGTYLLTNLFICAGVVRHWNDKTNVYVEVKMEEPVPPMVYSGFNRTGQFE